MKPRVILRCLGRHEAQRDGVIFVVEGVGDVPRVLGQMEPWSKHSLIVLELSKGVLWCYPGQGDCPVVMIGGGARIV